jgi:hypothetical protein
VNGNRELDWNDIEYLIASYIGSGPLPSLAEAADANCDGRLALDDILYLVEFMRGDGEPPCCVSYY